jgi:rubrerythrin
MAENKTLEYLIDLAITKEDEAYTFYMGLTGRVSDNNTMDTLKFLANEEKKHKEFLINYRNGKIKTNSLRMSDTVDYKIADYLEQPDLEKNINSKDIYLVAAHKELNSYNFYKSLSEAQPAGEVKDMLLKMANEEMKHKEKVEYLYSNAAFLQTEGG